MARAVAAFGGEVVQLAASAVCDAEPSEAIGITQLASELQLRKAP